MTQYEHTIDGVHFSFTNSDVFSEKTFPDKVKTEIMKAESIAYQAKEQLREINYLEKRKWLKNPQHHITNLTTYSEALNGYLNFLNSVDTQYQDLIIKLESEDRAEEALQLNSLRARYAFRVNTLRKTIKKIDEKQLDLEDIIREP